MKSVSETTKLQTEKLKEVFKNLDKKDDVKKVVIGDSKLTVEDISLKEQMNRLIKAFQDASIKEDTTMKDMLEEMKKFNKKK